MFEQKINITFLKNIYIRKQVYRQYINFQTKLVNVKIDIKRYTLLSLKEYFIP